GEFYEAFKIYINFCRAGIQLPKRERIKKKFYGTREEARSDIFDYIEMFYNSKRRHGSSD
ncbi:IS3 family transposase, partial [Salmonella enterica]|nr:IS3 family transposase [Salmonella enterica]